MSDLLPEKQAFEFEARNVTCGYRGRARLHTLNVEIDEETWTRLKLLPDGAILRGVLFWCDGSDEASEPVIKVKKPRAERKKKEPKPKGPHSAYWQAMFIAGFQNMRDLQTVLSLSDNVNVKQAIKNLFGVESLTFVSPADFEAWAETRELSQLISISRQASAKVQEAGS